MPVVRSTDLAAEYAESLAQRLGDRLVRVSLFGSRARDEERPRSDYDLMIVLRDPSRRDRDAIHGIATELELKHEYTVDLSTKIVGAERFDELRRSGLPFWRRFLRDERILWPPTSSRRE